MPPTFPNVQFEYDEFAGDRQPIPEDSFAKLDPGNYAPPVENAEPAEDPLALINDEVVRMVMDRKFASDQFRSQKKIIWDKCWDHYLQVYDVTGKENWQSKVFWPETPKVVETIAANFHAALLTPKTPIEWQVKVRDAEQAIRDANDLIQNDINQSNFKLGFTDNLREMCILGTTVGAVEYDLEESEVMSKSRRRAGLMERAIAEYQGVQLPEYEFDFAQERRVTKDHAKARYVDLYKIFPEPYSTEISKKHWIIEETTIKNSELIELSNHTDDYYRLENITEEMLRFSTSDKSSDPDTASKRTALHQNAVINTHLDPDQEHQLDVYWGPAPYWMVHPETKDDVNYKYLTCNAWFWVIDGKTLVRRKMNPYRDAEPPYFKLPYIKVPGDWWGIGPVELIMHLQSEKNELVNTAIDNINIMLNKIIAILKDKIPTDCWNRLKSAPGALWLFENTDDIRRVMMPVEFQNLLKDIYMAIDMVDRAIQEVTGAVKATIGAGGAEDEAGGGTFRGQLLNKQAASERFMLYARTIEAGGLSEIWRKIYQRIYQYKSYEAVEKILGAERFKTFEFILPEDLDAVADLVPLGVMTLETKGVKLAQMDQFAKTWMGRPWLKEYDLARREWLEMGHTDPDSVIFSSEEMKEFNEMRRMLAGMGEMSGMPGEERVPGGSGMRPSPIAGNVPGPTKGLPREAMPARGPGASPIDGQGMPL